MNAEGRVFPGSTLTLSAYGPVRVAGVDGSTLDLQPPEGWTGGELITWEVEDGVVVSVYLGQWRGSDEPSGEV